MKVVKQHCRGRVELFRYCDDVIICCQSEYDADRIKRALGKRLSKYGLRLNKEKTKMVSFSKRKAAAGKKQGTFDFLGFTFYLGRSRKGFIIPKVKTSGKRIRSKLKRVGLWARKIKDRCDMMTIWQTFGRKMRGHIQYYSVSYNDKTVKDFQYQAIRILFKWLNRRSQRKSFNWDRFRMFMKAFPPTTVKVYHSLL